MILSSKAGHATRGIRQCGNMRWCKDAAPGDQTDTDSIHGFTQSPWAKDVTCESQFPHR